MEKGLTIESEEAARLATTLRDALERSRNGKEGMATQDQEVAEYLELRKMGLSQ